MIRATEFQLSDDMKRCRSVHMRDVSTSFVYSCHRSRPLMILRHMGRDASLASNGVEFTVPPLFIW